MELHYIKRIMLHDVNRFTSMACAYTALIKYIMLIIEVLH